MAGRRRFWNYPRRNKGPVQRWLPSWRLIWKVGLGSILGVLAMSGGVFFAAWSSTDIPSETLDGVESQVTRVYYANGNEIGTFHEYTRELVKLEDLPDHVPNAVIASEDATFWTNNGVDVRGIGRAVLNNLSGGSQQGASTLTQQYVEQYYLGRTSGYLMKAKEGIISLKVARSQPKDLILERYLNTIYFGRGAYGIEAAAQVYFDKPAAELTYSEAAMLSGIIPAPVAYDPSVQLDVAQFRWQRSINRMWDQGYITDAERESAEFPEFEEKQENQNRLGGQEGYILHEVRRELLRNGFTEEELETRGYQIHTSIRPKLQREARSIVRDIPDDASPNLRAAVVSIDPSNGEIVTLYGGDDYLKQSINVATQDVMDGASTFKPFTLIGALEEGIELNETYDGNSPGHLDPEDPEREWPRNFGGHSYGTIDLIKATADSVNTAYVELNIEIGPEKTAEVAHRLGIREDEQNPIGPYRANVLGSEVRPVDLASAYATIASGGYYVQPHLVRNVTHMDGVTPRYEPDVVQERRFEPDIMTQATFALQQVVEEGSGRAAQQLSGPDGERRPVAGKTGTSNNNQAAWFAGYTPQLATVVGLRQYKAVDLEAGVMQGTEAISTFGGYREITGSTWPAEAWTGFMQVALENRDVEEFPTYVPPRPLPSPTPSVEEPTTVTIPDNLVGKHVTEARQILEGLGLRVNDRAVESEQPVGTVVAVDGSGEVAVGSTVNLQVSTGQTAEPERVTVPNVAGQDRRSAEQQLRRVGLRANVTEEYSDQPRGVVIRTDPGGGSSVEQGATVTVVVSRGPESDQGGGNGGGNGGGGPGNGGGGPGDGDDDDDDDDSTLPIIPPGGRDD